MNVDRWLMRPRPRPPTRLERVERLEHDLASIRAEAHNTQRWISDDVVEYHRALHAYRIRFAVCILSVLLGFGAAVVCRLFGLA